MSRTVFTTLLLIAASGCPAAAAENEPDVRFETRNLGDGYVRLSIRRDDWDYRSSNWSQRIALADLKGMTSADIERGGPVSFSYVRPAGRIDCKGTARDGLADGRCTLTTNEAFSSYLASKGIERPTRNQYFGLAMSGVDSDVIDAVIKEGLGTPSPEQLIGLGVFRITAPFIRDMAHVNGFKLSIHDLVQFKIFRITPEAVQAYAALGYRNLKGSDLVTFSIHRITPDFIRELGDLGYRDIPAQTLVQMRLFGVTPNYVRNLQLRSDERPSAEALVRRRLTGITRATSWAETWRRNWQGRRGWDWSRDRRDRRD